MLNHHWWSHDGHNECEPLVRGATERRKDWRQRCCLGEIRTMLQHLLWNQRTLENDPVVRMFSETIYFLLWDLSLFFSFFLGWGGGGELFHIITRIEVPPTVMTWFMCFLNCRVWSERDIKNSCKSSFMPHSHVCHCCIYAHGLNLAHRSINEIVYTRQKYTFAEFYSILVFLKQRKHSQNWCHRQFGGNFSAQARDFSNESLPSAVSIFGSFSSS